MNYDRIGGLLVITLFISQVSPFFNIEKKAAAKVIKQQTIADAVPREKSVRRESEPLTSISVLCFVVLCFCFFFFFSFSTRVNSVKSKSSPRNNRVYGGSTRLLIICFSNAY